MISSAHNTDHIEAPHSSYPYGAVQRTAGTTHRHGRLVAVGVLLLLIAVGVIVSL